jgi:microsomal dipeptidase-like Zn-dependent dipeptidase
LRRGSLPSRNDTGGRQEACRRTRRRGVAYITLAHLFWRDIATNAPALPFLTDAWYDRIFPQPENVGLSDLGRAAVQAMYEAKILTDLSHMSPRATDETI